MVSRRTFERSASSVAGARRFVAAALRASDVPSATVLDLAQLAVSELATNAVHDGSRTPPMLHRGGLGDARGRGLRLVDTIAARWGCASDRAGKRIWCDLLVAESPGC